MSNIRVNKLKTYDQVYFEISGVCNAKCRYCVTGRANHPAGGFIDTGHFQEALSILFKNKLVHNKTYFSLYNWGEPTLHPTFAKIIKLIQNTGGGI
jgi:wyosine [tRNA(Phe)-imidazoG37] synthetase (radical SAM superfamily)